MVFLGSILEILSGRMGLQRETENERQKREQFWFTRKPSWTSPSYLGTCRGCGAEAHLPVILVHF
jgi:hypothetical protein